LSKFDQPARTRSGFKVGRSGQPAGERESGKNRRPAGQAESGAVKKARLPRLAHPGQSSAGLFVRAFLSTAAPPKPQPGHRINAHYVKNEMNPSKLYH